MSDLFEWIAIIESELGTSFEYIEMIQILYLLHDPKTIYKNLFATVKIIYRSKDDL